MLIKDKKEFEQSIKDGITLVDFYADWCGPCKMLKPVIAQVETEWKTGKVLKINIDEVEELAEKYDVQTIPTLVYFKNGKEVARTVGFQTKDAILTKLNTL